MWIQGNLGSVARTQIPICFIPPPLKLRIHVTFENKWLAEQISQKNHFQSFYGNWKIDHWRETEIMWWCPGTWVYHDVRRGCPSVTQEQQEHSEAEQYWKFQDHRDGKLMGLENGGYLHEWLMGQRMSSSSWNNRKGLTGRTVSINQSAILNSEGRAKKHCTRAERTASRW